MRARGAGNSNAGRGRRPLENQQPKHDLCVTISSLQLVIEPEGAAWLRLPKQPSACYPSELWQHAGIHHPRSMRPAGLQRQ